MHFRLPQLRLPQPYTILVTRTGDPPIAVTLRPLPLALAAVALVSFPVIWGIVWATQLVSQNAQLTQRNQTLTETAGEVLLEIETLDEQLEVLRERAGLSERTGPVSPQEPERSQGGGSYPISAEDLLDLAKSRVPNLNRDLEANIRPALEETLAIEVARAAAMPSAKPLARDLEVSSEFGLRRNPFGMGGYEMHKGIDFRGPVGTPVYATGDGTVTTAAYNGGYGKQVVIDHGHGFVTLYAHLSTIRVETGTWVKRGDILGTLGSTGRSSGPHLHYEIHRNGKAINPRFYLRFDEE